MVRGKLRCLGSALDLKNRFGSGYRLIVGLLKDQCIGSINVEKNIIDLLRKSMSVKTGKSPVMWFVEVVITLCDLLSYLQ